MTWSEVSQFGTMVAAVLAAAVSWRNSRKIEKVAEATNGMKDELVAEVRRASLAKGRAEGVAAEHERASHADSLGS